MTTGAWRQFWITHSDPELFEVPRSFSRASHPGLAVDSECVFHAIVSLASKFNAIHNTVLSPEFVRFYADGTFVQRSGTYLPTPADGTFLGWHDRLRSSGLVEYTAVFNKLETVSRELRDAVYEFLCGTASVIGVPCDRAEITAFAGCYTRTPFGVHQDAELNFYFPLLGHKQLRFWRPNFRRTDPTWPSSLAYEEHTTESMTLSGGSGDLMTWNGAWWHIGEGTGDCTVAVSVPLMWYPHRKQSRGDSISRSVFEYVYREMCAMRGETLFEVDVGSGATPIPEIFEEALSAVTTINEDELRDWMTERWLCKVTGAGLRMAPPSNQPPALRGEDVVEGRGHERVRWAELSDDRMCVAIRGVTLTVPHSKMFIDVIDQVNVGSAFRVSDMIIGESQKHGTDADSTLEFLRVLIHLGAARVVRSNSSLPKAI